MFKIDTHNSSYDLFKIINSFLNDVQMFGRQLIDLGVAKVIHVVAAKTLYLLDSSYVERFHPLERNERRVPPESSKPTGMQEGIRDWAKMFFFLSLPFKYALLKCCTKDFFEKNL